MVIKHGLFAGFITIFIYSLAYIIAPEYYSSRIVYFLTLSIYILVMYKLAATISSDDTLDFKSILRALFICFLMANIIYFMFNYFMIAVYDPELKNAQDQMILQDRLLSLDIKPADLTFTWSGYLLQYCQSAIGGFMMAASIAYSKRPLIA